MRPIRRGFLLVVCASSVLAACASHGPADSTGTTASSGSTPVAAAAPDTGKSAIPKGYRRVVKKGDEYFCRLQPVTGSHTLKTEICLTRDELDAEKNRSVAIGLNPPAPGQGGAGSPSR